MINYIKKYLKSFPQKSLTSKMLTLGFLLLYTFLMCIALIQVDYEIVTPGTLQSATGDVSISTSNEAGNIFTIGVYTNKKISVFQKWLVDFNHKMDIEPFNELSDLSFEDYNQYATYLKELSITKALITAYEAAALINPEITIAKEFHGLLATAKLPYANTQVQVGDIIQKINTIEITSYSAFVAVAQTIGTDENYTVTVLRDFGSTNERIVELAQNKRGQNPVDGKYYMGFSADEYYTIDQDATSPSYFTDAVFQAIGSSGGAMLTLAIYNSLLEEDITKGINVAGTGTINMDGTIGIVGALKQKVYTASRYRIQVFFVPADIDDTEDPSYNNYSVALEAYNDVFQNSTPTFDLVAVRTFQDILDYLENVEEGGTE